MNCHHRLLVCIFTCAKHAHLEAEFLSSKVGQYIQHADEVDYYFIEADESLHATRRSTSRIILSTPEEYGKLCLKTLELLRFAVDHLSFDRLVKIDVTTLANQDRSGADQRRWDINQDELESWFRQLSTSGDYSGYYLHPSASLENVKNWIALKGGRSNPEPLIQDQHVHPFFSGKCYSISRSLCEYAVSHCSDLSTQYVEHFMGAEDVMVGNIYKEYVQAKQSDSLGIKLIGSKGESPIAEPITLVSVIRNEVALLPYFIDYYKSLGIERFIFVDNDSTDGGLDYLLARDDIHGWIYSAKGSYKDADYGVRWSNHILVKHCIKHYVLVVDADELLDVRSLGVATMQELRQNMARQNANAVYTTLVDMYPYCLNDNYSSGADFRLHSPYHDKLDSTSIQEWKKIYNDRMHLVGGMRNRVFGVTVCLHKLPFFRYDFFPFEVAAGCHYFAFCNKVIDVSPKIRLYTRNGFLLHFKYLKPGFSDHVAERVHRNQDWNDSKEYRAYHDQMIQRKSPLVFYSSEHSTVSLLHESRDRATNQVAGEVLVSVIVPVYNKEDYLRPCLDSIRSQSHRSLEIICIDDCSSDSCLDILNDVASIESRMTICSTSSTMGPAHCRNLGLSKAHGSYVRFVDADDLIPQASTADLLERALASKADLVRGSLHLFRDHDIIIDEINVPNASLAVYQDYKELCIPWWHTSYLIDRRFLVANNLTYPLLSRGEDPVFIASCLTKAKRISLLPSCVYLYRKYQKEGGSADVTYRAIRDHMKHYKLVKQLFCSSGMPCWHEFYAEHGWTDYERTLRRATLTLSELNEIEAMAADLWPDKMKENANTHGQSGL